MQAVRVLVNSFYAQPVGHAVEALHYALGHHAAGPGRDEALSDSFRDLVAAHEGATAGIWSIDGIHAGYV